MILELENICKEYMQGKIPVPVLKNINFSMEEGEYVAIMELFRFRKNNTDEYCRLPRPGDERTADPRRTGHQQMQ